MTKYVALVLFYGQILGAIYKVGQKTAQTDGKKQFAEWLVAEGFIDHRGQCEALDEQKKRSCQFVEALQSLKLMSEEQLATALGEFLSIDYVALDDVSKINMSVAWSIPESIAKRFNLVAIDEKAGKIVVAMADPLDLVAQDIVTLKTKRRVHTVISSSKNIQKAREAVYHGSSIEEEHLRDLVQTEIARQ